MVSPANTPEIEFDALEVPAGIAMKATVAATARPGLHLLMCTVSSSPLRTANAENARNDPAERCDIPRRLNAQLRQTASCRFLR